MVVCVWVYSKLSNSTALWLCAPIWPISHCIYICTSTTICRSDEGPLIQRKRCCLVIYRSTALVYVRGFYLNNVPIFRSILKLPPTLLTLRGTRSRIHAVYESKVYESILLCSVAGTSSYSQLTGEQLFLLVCSCQVHFRALHNSHIFTVLRLKQLPRKIPAIPHLSRVGLNVMRKRMERAIQP